MPYEHIADIFLCKVSKKDIKESYFEPNMLKFYFLVLKNIHFDTKKMLKSANYIWIYDEKCIFFLEMSAILKTGRHFEFCVANRFLLKYMPC